jgi:uncharacterized protein YbaP (TraB family)
MHSADARLKSFDDIWFSAFASCKLLAGETDLSSGASDMASMLEFLMTDTTISMVLPKAQVDLIQGYIASRLGEEMASMLIDMQPFFLMVWMMELPDNLNEVEGVMDIYLQNLATSQGKMVIGLETAAEQLEVIRGVPFLYQAEMLYDFVWMESMGESNDVITMSDSMLVQTYLRQCPDEFMSLAKEIDLNEQLMEQLLPLRNERFVNRLEKIMQDHPVFCAIGALHLPGDNGMIAMLRNRGYEVLPVSFKFLH